MKLSHRLAAVMSIACLGYAVSASAETDGFSIQADAMNAAEGDSFSIEVVNASLAAGSEGTIRVTIKAKTGFKVNDKYPHKIKFDDPPSGVSLPKKTLKKGDGRFEGTSSFVFDVPVKAESKGSHTVGGNVKFSVCNDEQCQIKKAQITAKVNAS